MTSIKVPLSQELAISSSPTNKTVVEVLVRSTWLYKKTMFRAFIWELELRLSNFISPLFNFISPLEVLKNDLKPFTPEIL